MKFLEEIRIFQSRLRMHIVKENVNFLKDDISGHLILGLTVNLTQPCNFQKSRENCKIH